MERPEAGPFVVFCDLDGTLVLDNSFHVFLAVLWSNASISQRARLLVLLASRALGRIGGGHAGLKRRVLLWLTKQDQGWRARTVEELLRRLSKTLSQPVLEEVRNWRDRGARIVLATAAPDVYAKELASRMGFECLATPGVPNSNWTELVGQAKADACARWLRERYTDPAPWIVVLTDHADDLPLLRMGDELVIQGPSRRLQELAKLLQGRKVRAMDTDRAEKPGGYWLWMDDKPVGPLDGWEVRTVLTKHRHAAVYVGEGQWRRIRPGDALTGAVVRRTCPTAPRSRFRLFLHVYRLLVRNWLGIFH